MKIVKVTVDDLTGEFDVDLTGYQGKGCDAIIEAFGELGQIKTHTHKTEFNQTNNAVRTVKAGQ